MPLEDYLLPETEQDKLARMLASLPAEYDTSEGSPLYDALAPIAVEAAIAGDRLRIVMEWAFASTSFGEYLELRAEEHGVYRNAAVPATGLVTFTGTPGTVIPVGSEVTTPSTEGVPAQIYATDIELVLDGDGSSSVAVTAISAGAEGNVGVGAITMFPAIPGLTGVTNAAATTGGFDEESDESLLVKYLDRVRNPSSSGNVADYRRWAREVAGVGGVSVVPLEDGPGTVTVAIIDDERSVPDPALVALVQAYIDPVPGMGEGTSPVGATVTVEGATAVVINVVADLTVAAGYVEATVRAQAALGLAAYLDSLSFTADNDVRHARIVTTILDTPGVTDVTGVTINGGTSNIAIGAKQIATLGTVTWS